MHRSERSVQRTADVRYGGLVQVDSRPARCLRRKTHLSNPIAQTTKARGEFGSLPGKLRDSATKEPRERLSEPTFQTSLQRGHHRWWDQPEIIIQGHVRLPS